MTRAQCRRAERKWKKDRLHVSFQMLRDCWRHYQTNVKDLKIILSNCNKPRVLFKTIDSVLNAPQTVCIDASPAVCENFLHFFLLIRSLPLELLFHLLLMTPQSLSSVLLFLTGLSL